MTYHAAFFICGLSASNRCSRLLASCDGVSALTAALYGMVGQPVNHLFHRRFDMEQLFHSATLRLQWRRQKRLVCALEAGRHAGGQVAGQHSAALLVVHKKSRGWIDLRVDEHDEPIGELRRLYGLYLPLIPYYDARPSKPSMPRDDQWRQQTGVKGGPR